VGFSRIGAGDLAGARQEIEAALVVLERGVDDRARRALGACLYNLGRVEEGEGHADPARAAYRRSLEVRPNATVEERLRSLGP
jgi:Flp pilus assembly protein TadD